MRYTVLVILLLASAPAGVLAETESWTGDLRGPSLAADAHHMQASVVAAVVITSGGVEDPLPWALEGTSVRVTSMVEVRNDPRDPPNQDPDDPCTVTGPRRHVSGGEHDHFTAHPARSSPGRTYLLPHPDAGPPALERFVGPVELFAHGGGVVRPPGLHADGGQGPGHSVDGTVFLQDLDPPFRYVLRGDFLLVVHGDDWVVTDAGGQTAYTSGSQGPPPCPGGAHPGLAWAPERTEQRVLHLLVRNGTLALPGSSDWHLEPYLDAVEVASDRVEARAATGTLRAGTLGVSVAGDDLAFHGPTHVGDVRADGGVLHYGVASSAPALLVDGGAVDAPRTTGSSPATLSPQWVADAPAGPGPWWGLLLLLPAAILVARPPFWLVALGVRVGLHGYAARNAPRFLSGRHGPAAAIVGAVALLRDARFADAHRFLDALPRAVRPAPATWHYLQAHGSAGAGDDLGAARHLNACLDLAPEYGREVLGNPVLRRIVDADPGRFAGSLGRLRVP